jgi:hypothetical protein
VSQMASVIVPSQFTSPPVGANMRIYSQGTDLKYSSRGYQRRLSDPGDQLVFGRHTHFLSSLQAKSFPMPTFIKKV